MSRLVILVALAMALALALPDTTEATSFNEVKKLLASDAHGGFGWSVAVSGDSIVVGALAGAAYVFQRNEGGADSWGEVTKLTASGVQSDGDLFGSSVAISGDTAIVGADEEDAGVSRNTGAAYVFQRDQGGQDNWGEVTKLTASDAQPDDRFGYSVSISGDTAVVGAHAEDAGGSSLAGAAYVFQRDEGGAENWGEVTKLTASDAQVDDNFGRSVGLSGGIAVVGADHEDAGGDNAGAAYVFDLRQPKATFTLTPAPTSTPVPPAPDGDVNCGGTTDAIDAALILQFAADLIAALPCPGNADVSGDGEVDPVDAELVLQEVAGLVGLPR